MAQKEQKKKSARTIFGEYAQQGRSNRCLQCPNYTVFFTVRLPLGKYIGHLGPIKRCRSKWPDHLLSCQTLIWTAENINLAIWIGYSLTLTLTWQHIATYCHQDRYSSDKPARTFAIVYWLIDKNHTKNIWWKLKAFLYEQSTPSQTDKLANILHAFSS